MKAKACTKCRQWKARCDYDEGTGGCARCRSLNLPCVFDATFRRTSRNKSIQRMSSEIQRLRQALDGVSTNGPPSIQTVESIDETLISSDRGSQFSGIPTGPTGSSLSLLVLPPSGSLTSPGALPAPYQIADAVALTSAQVNEHFRTFFARCHHFLPFQMMTRSPDAIYAQCPLLFWAICAAAASWKLRAQLAPSLKAMLADTIHSPPRSIEKVQALLIMSMWPFSVTAIMQDPADFYCSLATQMALQIGLHRPSQSHLHDYGSEEHAEARTVDYQVQTTTWLACFVVNQRQFLVRGVPQSVWVDNHLLKAFDDESVDQRLSQFCRIYHVMMQVNLSIGAEAPTPSGMLEPGARLAAIKSWAEVYSALEMGPLKQMGDVVRIAFLSSRMQLFSFALLDDMPDTPEIFEYVQSAKQDACNLIELCYFQNLAIAPAHVRHAISYSGFVLVKILRSHYSTESEVLQDHIERVRQALSTTTSSPDDTYRKACQTIQWLTYVEDKKLSAPIYTRMGASLVYDLLRTYSENKFGPSLVPDEPGIDLDGFDWNFWDWFV